MVDVDEVVERILQYCLKAVDAPYGLIALIDY